MSPLYPHIAKCVHQNVWIFNLIQPILGHTKKFMRQLLEAYKTLGCNETSHFNIFFKKTHELCSRNNFAKNRKKFINS